MKVMLLGSGGRESALAWGLDRSASVEGLLVAPGNPGTHAFAESHALDPSSPKEVLEVARRWGADLVVIGPEAPLMAGVGDALRSEGIRVFGPDAAAARIEGSKRHAKSLMDRAGIATARWEAFESPERAVAFMDGLGPPYVIKADGLAAGKGVVVTSDRDEAVEAVRDCLIGGRFGAAGRTVVIEEFLDGQECSLIAFTDGKEVVPCEPAQDYKRVYDDDDGANTGGMGSYSPVPACPPELAAQLVDDVLRPMVRATADAGAPFVGALYAGLALTSAGPRVVEFNARFGDPETQALIPRLRSDLGEVCLAAATGDLGGTELEWSPDPCVTVILASGGYPGSFRSGLPIEGVDQAASREGVQVFHAGTGVRDGALVTSGGRVLAVSATGVSFADARARAYAAADMIGFEGKHVRRDIALRAEHTEATSV